MRVMWYSATSLLLSNSSGTLPAASRLLLYGFLLSLVSACGGVVGGSNFIVTDEVDVNPSVRAEFEKGVKLLEQKKYEDGIRVLKRVALSSENSIAPHINLGIAYMKINELEKAEASLKKALTLNSAHPAANNEMAMVYRKTGRFAEARETYERILERYPGFYPARRNLGILCDLYIKDYRCAMANYEIYSRADPDDKSVRMWIADLEQRMKK